MQGYNHKYDFQPDFWAKISSIRIDPERYEWIFKPGDLWRNGVSGIQDQITWFWSQILSSFPSTKRVLLDNYRPHGCTPRQGDAETEDWAILRKVLDMAPKHVEVRILINGGRYRYSNDRQNQRSPVGSNKWHGWKLLFESEWQPIKTISAPGVWKLPENTLNEYERMRHTTLTLRQEMTGHKWLCEVWPKITSPALTQAFLEAKQDRIHNLKLDLEKRWLKIREDMGNCDPTSCKDASYEQNLEAEVKRYIFPDYEQRPPHEVCPLREYMSDFWSYFHSPHIYYSPAIADHDEDPYDDQNGMITDFEAEQEDEDPWSTPPPDPRRLEAKKQTYDEFWKKAGFLST